MLKAPYRITLLALLLGFSAIAYSEVHFSDSRTWRRARLVAAGQQVWSFQSSYQKISDRFTANGKVEPIGNRYARSLTWGQLLNAETTPQARAEMEDYMKRNGVNEKDVAATSTYELEREEIGFSVDWAYGLTKRWMIGFQVPVVLRKTQVKQNVDLAPVLARGAGQAGQKSVLGLNSNQVREKARGLAQDEMANDGYDDVPDGQQSWDWGDVNLLSQFYLYSGRDWNWALQQMVRFPTSRNPSVSDYFQQASDDGQLDLGLTSLIDYRVRRWTLGGRLGYVAQLPDSAKMRTPEGSGVDPKVHRDLGDWIWGAVDADYRLTRRLGLDLEYAFLAKSQDKYKGASVNGTSYEVLGQDTNQEIHQTRLGLVYDVGTTTSRSGVDKKWVASLGYTRPWIGRNSNDASRASVELITYF